MHLVVCDDDNGLARIVSFLNIVESLTDRLEPSTLVLHILDFALRNTARDLNHELLEVFVAICPYPKAGPLDLLPENVAVVLQGKNPISVKVTAYWKEEDTP